MVTLEDSATGRFLDQLGVSLPRPRTVVVLRALHGSIANARWSHCAGDHLDWQTLPEARCNHPTAEHLFPLYVALGGGVRATQLHSAVRTGGMAMDAFAFD